jgi:starvation-inducible DNA-binding protein
MNSVLISALSQALADVTIFYHRIHGFHWNVTGKDFPQWHSKFEEIYEDVYGSIDPLAEIIRKLGAFAPFTLLELSHTSNLDDALVTEFDADYLVGLAYRDNKIVLDALKQAFDSANSANEQGAANFLAERIDAHQKWDWQLRASLAQ